MNVDELEALVDDYLRLVSRTRPWSRTPHAEALEAFLLWVRREHAGPGSAPGRETVA